MNEFVGQRIKNQLSPIKTQPAQIIEEIKVNDEPVPLSINELNSLLQPIFPEPKKVTEGMLIFYNLWDFSDWYLPQRELFTEAQKTALDTLVQTRDMVGVGCPCKRAHRETVALQYWRGFWQNNKDSDILPTILKIANVAQISFADLYLFP